MRPLSLHRYLAVLAGTLVLSGGFSIYVDAQTPSYVRRDNPVFDQAARFPQFTRLDASATSPVAYLDKARCFWSIVQDCLMCMHGDGGLLCVAARGSGLVVDGGVADGQVVYGAGNNRIKSEAALSYNETDNRIEISGGIKVGYTGAFGAGDVAAFNGNVGVGTAAPGALLHVSIPTNAIDQMIRMENTLAAPTGSNGDANLNLRNTVADWYVQVQTTGRFQVNEGPTTRFAINDGDGNVGLGYQAGDTIPYPLSVTHGSVANLLGLTRSADRQVSLAFIKTGRTWLLGADLSDNGGDEFFIHDLTVPATRFIINASGEIGIPTTSPGVLVNVVRGTGGDLLNLTNNVDQDLQINISASGAGDKRAFFNTSTSTNMAFGIAGSEKMRITSAGNVGIGTTGPTYRLQLVTGYDGDGIKLASSADGQDPELVIARASGPMARLCGVTYTNGCLPGTAVGDFVIQGLSSAGSGAIIFAPDNVTETMRLTAAGVLRIQSLSASLPVCTDGSSNLTTTGCAALTTVPFSGITSGTNTVAAMLVGTGASLDFSGSGTINASSLLGATWGSPGTIGSTTPNSGAFTTLSASSTVTFSSFTSNGGPLYTNGSGVLAQVAAGTATQVLHGGTTPSFSAVSLTADVTGTLPVGNGGTGITSCTDNYVLTGGATLSCEPNLTFNGAMLAVTGSLTTSGNATLGDATSDTATISGRAIFGAGQRVVRTTTATSYVIVSTDYYVGVTSTAAPRTVTLEPAATAGAGRVIIVKDESGGAKFNYITVEGDGTETIDGELNYEIRRNYESITLISDGVSAWFII